MRTKIKKLKILLLAMLGGLFTVQSQDIHFSQFTMSPLILNPAQAGAQHDLRAVVNYKNQWGSVADAYKTVNFSYDMKLNKKKEIKGYSAIGLNVFNDKAGDAKLGTFQVNLAYAYHVYLTKKSTLGGGLYAGFGQRSINYSNLQWGSQFDGSSYNSNLPTGEPVGSNSLTYFDLGGGCHWEYSENEKYMTGNDQRKYNAGIAVFHVTRPKYSFYKTNEILNIKTVGYANALIGISNSNTSLVPGILYIQQGETKEILLGSLFRYQFKDASKYTGYVKGSAISIGGYYRNNDAIIANVFYEFSQYAIGVSYDINVSGLKSASNGKGGIEISLRFINPNPFLYSSKSRI